MAQTAVSGPLYAMAVLAAKQAAIKATERCLDREDGGFDVDVEKAKAGTDTETAATPGADATAQVAVAAMDARYQMREQRTAVVEAAEYTVALDDDYVDVQYSYVGAVSIILPTANMTAKRRVTIVDGGATAGTNNITISTEGAEKIGSADTYVINKNGDSVVLVGVPGKNKWLPIKGTVSLA